MLLASIKYTTHQVLTSVNEFQNSNIVDTMEMLLIQTYSEPLFRLVGVVSLKKGITSFQNLIC
jgi:hypothetical protein